MSFEINPVLAGKFDAPETQVARNSVASTDDVSGPDPRRYTQFDRTVTDCGETTMSFGDFLDMINPLQHIPIVSSVYRAVTGEEIHPVARVAGDILYGGLIGAGSAILGGISAVADASLEASTGKDSSGIVIAALFGDEEVDKSVQLADASPTVNPPPQSQVVEAPKQLATAEPLIVPKTTSEVAEDQTPELSQLADVSTVVPPPSPASPASDGSSSRKIELAQIAAANPMLAALAIQDAVTASTGNIKNAAAVASDAQAPMIPDGVPGSAPLKSALLGAIPLASGKPGEGKLPYGGVMGSHGPTNLAENMATALAEGAPTTRMGNMIYTNRFANGRNNGVPPMIANGAPKNPTAVYAPVPTMPAVASQLGSTSNNVIAAQAAMTPPAHKNPLPPELVQDMMLKAIGHYQNSAVTGRSLGGSINLTN